MEPVLTFYPWKAFIFFLAGVLLPITTALADNIVSTNWPAADPAAVAQWQSLRFGMFIHWGPVSLTGKEIGWSRGATNGTPVEIYDNLYKQFNPTNFNADQWVSIAKAAGMKYIVLTCKHHDGFCLWDTKLTDYNIMNSPFHRDVVKELSEACKKQGIEFGAYYSVMDNYNTNYPYPVAKEKNHERDHYDMGAYEKYLQGQITELIQNYGPLLTIWNDVPKGYKERGADTIKLVRNLQPDILMNDRTGDGGDYDTPEQKVGKFQTNRPWESCMTVSAHNHWAWGGSKDGVKSPEACLEMLIRCAGGDGNMMLNVGPRPDGVIDPAQADVLKQIGDWLKKNGESIYGTRGGPWVCSKEIASTRKGSVVYVHVLRADGDRIELPALPQTIKSASELGGGKINIVTVGRKIILHLPSQKEGLPRIIKLDLDGSAMEIPAIPLPAS
jgi:alpha-L-fucosidase